MRVNAFRTDYWYGLKVCSAMLVPETQLWSYHDRVDVEFLVSEVGRTGDSDPPKARMSMRFNPDGTPVERGDERLGEVLGVPLPIDHGVDWSQLLVGQRIEGQFKTPPRPDTWNSLKTVRPLASDEQSKVSAMPCLTMKSVITSSPAIILSERRSTQPVVTGLSLEALPQGLNRKYVARMVLKLETSSINKDIGVRQLLFLHLFVKIGRLLPIDNNEWTVLDVDQVSQAFREWVKDRYLVKKEGESTKTPSPRTGTDWSTVSSQRGCSIRSWNLVGRRSSSAFACRRVDSRVTCRKFPNSSEPENAGRDASD